MNDDHGPGFETIKAQLGKESLASLRTMTRAMTVAFERGDLTKIEEEPFEIGGAGGDEKLDLVELIVGGDWLAAEDEDQLLGFLVDFLRPCERPRACDHLRGMCEPCAFRDSFVDHGPGGEGLVPPTGVETPAEAPKPERFELVATLVAEPVRDMGGNFVGINFPEGTSNAAMNREQALALSAFLAHHAGGASSLSEYFEADELPAQLAALAPWLDQLDVYLSQFAARDLRLSLDALVACYGACAAAWRANGEPSDGTEDDLQRALRAAVRQAELGVYRAARKTGLEDETTAGVIPVVRRLAAGRAS